MTREDSEVILKTHQITPNIVEGSKMVQADSRLFGQASAALSPR